MFGVVVDSSNKIDYQILKIIDTGCRAFGKFAGIAIKVNNCWFHVYELLEITL